MANSISHEMWKAFNELLGWKFKLKEWRSRRHVERWKQWDDLSNSNRWIIGFIVISIESYRDVNLRNLSMMSFDFACMYICLSCNEARSSPGTLSLHILEGGKDGITHSVCRGRVKCLAVVSPWHAMARQTDPEIYSDSYIAILKQPWQFDKFSASRVNETAEAGSRGRDM